MHSLTAMYRVPVRTTSCDGTFDGVRPVLLRAAEAGFDAICLGAFDAECGSTESLLSLCEDARRLGFSVLVELACLFDGIHSPLPLVCAAEERGWFDGFLLNAEARRFSDLMEHVRRCGKERRPMLFVLEQHPPCREEKTDGAYRQGLDIHRLLHAVDDDTNVAALYSTRHPTYTPLMLDVLDRDSTRRADAALVLSVLLPGALLLSDSLSLLTSPTEDGARRRALVSSLMRLAERCPALRAPSPAPRIEWRAGHLCVSRRTEGGTFWFFWRPAAVAETINDRVLQTVPPEITSGVYRADGLITLLPDGFALCFVPRPPRPAPTDAPPEEDLSDGQQVEACASVGD